MRGEERKCVCEKVVGEAWSWKSVSVCWVCGEGVGLGSCSEGDEGSEVDEGDEDSVTSRYRSGLVFLSSSAEEAVPKMVRKELGIGRWGSYCF